MSWFCWICWRLNWVVILSYFPTRVMSICCELLVCYKNENFVLESIRESSLVIQNWWFLFPIFWKKVLGCPMVMINMDQSQLSCQWSNVSCLWLWSFLVLQVGLSFLEVKIIIWQQLLLELIHNVTVTRCCMFSNCSQVSGIGVRLASS